MKHKLIPLVLVVMLGFAGCGKTEITSEKAQLTLACWIKDSWLQVLVDQYNAVHEDYEIVIKDYYDGGVEDDLESSYAKMNIDLMSGEVPDIYYLDSMDVPDLVRVGLLADLYTYMDNDESFNEDDYLMNIISLFETDGCLYELAPSFTITGLCGPSSLLGNRQGWTIEEFTDYSDSLSNEKTALAYRRDMFFAFMLRYSSNDFFEIEQDSYDFASDSFIKTLEFAASLPEKSDLDNSILKPSTIMEVGNYISDKNRLSDRPTYVGYPCESASGPCASVIANFAISAYTSYPDACWDFLRLLLNQEIQQNILLGFPTLRSQLNREINEALYDEDKPFDQEDADYLKGLIDSLDHASFKYEGVTSIVFEEADIYFSGGSTAEHTAEVIQNRVTTFFEERK